MQQIRTDTIQHQHDQADTQVHGNWLVLARLGWLTLTLLILALTAIALPRFTVLAQSVCQPHAPCLDIQLQQDDLRLLKQLGLSPAFFAAYQVGWAVVTVLIHSALAALIFWRRSNDRMALVCAYMLVLFGGATYTGLFDYGLRPLAPTWYWLVGLLDLLGQISLPLFLLLFPSGRFVPRWSRWGVIVVVLQATQYVFFSNLLYSNTDEFSGLSFAGLLLFLIGLQVYRYLRVSTFRERQQTKWVVFGCTVALVGFALFIIVGNLTLTPEVRDSHTMTILVLGTAGNILLLLIPVSIAIAVLRSRLWDIDVIINRTLVYSLLTGSVIGIYVLVVGYLGALFRTGSNPIISLAATGLVAVIFQPLRGLLQRWVNRLLYGERDEPHTVIMRLTRQLETTLAPDAMLPTIVETLVRALKLPYAAILLRQDDDFVTAASFGSLKGEPLTLPLVYQQETIGKLLLAPRALGEDFAPADLRLLKDVIGQVSLAAHAIRLTADLQHSNEHLQAAQARLITTREEERRRLRRDLHDGLGSALTSVTFQLDAASNLLDHDLGAAQGLLKELKGQVQASIADIRRLVYNLRPPILDEWGLIAALREQVAQYQLNNVQVSIDAPEDLSPLSAAIEVAAYRIVLEALANVIRHAQATTCTIRLALIDSGLTLEIQDNGVGIPENSSAGVGISAMRERAAELGGTCRIESTGGTGTRVTAFLPLLKEE
ncbi:hypothetical protein KSC_110880 [Ktedonobacter sp. SOSP1-52]|uniref:sensor histidine kinase n=1 Tax=Ktedonobacter sp. SOSP1-52 TaxID=2778366 RepID=UPI00191549D7|nr:ATP-binding protein [Ktedonobacter sp. SOSP1-52]GHO72196.1 hypothetical protein KSC_110880 [Ktedonobacter sp. SOSP1-52]